MTTPNAPTGAAAEHLQLTPKYPNGVFNQPWPGLHPTVAQRRAYMNAFMNWYLWHTNFEAHERTLREESEQVAFEGYMRINKVPQSSMAFEATVDYLVWKAWFAKLPKVQKPKYPWLGVEHPQTEDDTGSAKFAQLRANWDGKETARPKAPEDSQLVREDFEHRLREIGYECGKHGIDMMWWEADIAPKSGSVGPAKKRLKRFVPEDRQ